MATTAQNDEEWTQTIAVMVGLWRKRTSEMTPMEIMSWRKSIGGYPADLCAEAMEWWYGNETFFPHACQIRSILAKKTEKYGRESAGYSEAPSGATQEEKNRVREEVRALSSDQISKIWDEIVNERPEAALVRDSELKNIGWHFLAHKQAKKMGMIKEPT